ncbi:DNA mismatch repair protein mutS [Clonorchis sinensis]|uniref:DNA mismatch repair protein mutS n=1 Tax=Clonorchis sinensis TaxID=79923 RepID=G7YVD5_CLOSI|nr:DNA mismatch repair protein mutS [Clonorchis sinensis]
MRHQFSVKCLVIIFPVELFSVCITRAGKYTLEQWMRTPSRDLKCLNERLTAVECLLKTPGLTKSIRTTLRNIGHLPRIFYRMQQSSALPTDWKCLMQVICVVDFTERTLTDSNFPGETHSVMYAIRKQTISNAKPVGQ